EDSLERLQGDPDRARESRLVTLAEDIFSWSIAFIHPAIRLEVARQDATSMPDSPALAAFTTQACDVLDAMAQALRAGIRPTGLTGLRPAAEEVRRELMGTAASTDLTSAALVESTDQIARALDGLIRVLTHGQTVPAP